MIVTTKKNFNEILQSIGDHRRIVIVGCAECAAVCQTGGSQQVADMAESLSDREVLATISIQSPCDKRISSRDMKRIAEETENADAIIALTCGSGVQALTEVTGKKVIAALDTHFLGMVERLGRFYERCSHCGHCILNDTADICPVTRCPRKVKNGPCEFIIGDTCDVFPETECIWHTIYRRLKERGEEKRFLNYHKPAEWNNHHSPQEAVWQK
jgi:ferredoxin